VSGAPVAAGSGSGVEAEAEAVTARHKRKHRPSGPEAERDAWKPPGVRKYVPTPPVPPAVRHDPRQLALEKSCEPPTTPRPDQPEALVPLEANDAQQEAVR
jgi:hypothetical protein